MEPLNIPSTALTDFNESIVEANLALTPEQRLLRHQEALDLVLELENAGKQLLYGAESAPQDTER